MSSLDSATTPLAPLFMQKKLVARGDHAERAMDRLWRKPRGQFQFKIEFLTTHRNILVFFAIKSTSSIGIFGLVSEGKLCSVNCERGSGLSSIHCKSE